MRDFAKKKSGFLDSFKKHKLWEELHFDVAIP
jgi:hypothetical protein